MSTQHQLQGHNLASHKAVGKIDLNSNKSCCSSSLLLNLCYTIVKQHAVNLKRNFQESLGHLFSPPLDFFICHKSESSILLAGITRWHVIAAILLLVFSIITGGKLWKSEVDLVRNFFGTHFYPQRRNQFYIWKLVRGRWCEGMFLTFFLWGRLKVNFWNHYVAEWFWFWRTSQNFLWKFNLIILTKLNISWNKN